MPLLPILLGGPGRRWLLLGLLVLAGAAARAQAWQNVQPLPLPAYAGSYYCVSASSEVATVAANGSVYVAGLLERRASKPLGPHRGSGLLGHSAFVAKWNPRAHRLVWLLEMTRPPDSREDVGQEEATALAVRGNQVYVLGDFTGYTAGFGHPLKARGYQQSFVARLTDHGARATADWVQPLDSPGATTRARHLALANGTLYAAGTTTTESRLFDPATGHRVAPDTTGAFVVRLTDGGTRARQDWQHSWVVPSDGVYELTALVYQQQRLYLAENDWQLMTMDADPAEIQASEVLGWHRHYQTRLSCLRDQGATCARAWAWASAGYTHGLAVAGPAAYLVGHEDHTVPFGRPGQPAYAPGQGNALFVAKLQLGAAGARPGWVQHLPGTGYHDANALRYVVARGRRVFVAGTFGPPGLALGKHRLRPLQANGTPGQDIFVAQLTDAGPAGRFDWAERLGGASYDQLQDLALAGSRLYVRGLFEGYPGTPVLLGRQQLPLPADANEQVMLQAWRPLGPPAHPPRRRPLPAPRPGSSPRR